MRKPRDKRDAAGQETEPNGRSLSLIEMPAPASETNGSVHPEPDVPAEPAPEPQEPEDEPPEAAQSAAPRITAVQISDEPFPRPPRFDCQPQPFFDYWYSLKPGERARSTVYVYRAWPVLDHSRGLTPEEVFAIREKKRRLTTNIAKLTEPFSPQHWRDEILHRFGSGDYHFKLNDAGVRNNGKLPPRQMCQTTVRGLRDDDHPPVVDPKVLDLNDPQNRSYIQFLLMKGIQIPGLDEPEKPKENEDMAATERLAESVEKMADRNATLAAQIAAQSAAQAAAKDKPADVSTQASLAGMDIVKAAAQAALDFQAKATEASAKAQDPIVYHKNIMEAAERFKPAAPDPNGGGANMMDMMMKFLGMMQQSNKEVIQEIRESSRLVAEAQNARITFTEKIAQDALARSSNPSNAAPGTPGATTGTPAAPPDPIAGTLRVLEGMEKIMERTGVFGGKGSDGPWWARPAMTLAASIPTAISYAAYNAAVAKTGTGTPALPPQQPGEGEEIEDGAPALNQGAPQGTAVNPYIQFLQSIHKPLVNAVDQNLPGFVFAGNLVLSNGWGIYDQLHAAGKDQILTLLQSYPPVWQDVIKMPRFNEFLDEFLDRDKVAQAAEEFRIAQEAAREPAPPPPQKVSIKPKPRPAGPLPQAVVDAKGEQPKA